MRDFQCSRFWLQQAVRVRRLSAMSYGLSLRGYLLHLSRFYLGGSATAGIGAVLALGMIPRRFLSVKNDFWLLIFWVFRKIYARCAKEKDR